MTVTGRATQVYRPVGLVPLRRRYRPPGLVEDDLAVDNIGLDHIADEKTTREDRLRQWILQFLLNGLLERPRTAEQPIRQ